MVARPRIGFRLTRLTGEHSYNFPDDDARHEHYDTSTSP